VELYRNPRVKKGTINHLIFPIKYIPPNPENGSEADILIAMRSMPDLEHFIRLHAIRLLILGYPLQEVSI